MMKVLRYVPMMLLLAVVCSVSQAGEKADLKVGDKAPEFTSTDDQGKAWKSSDHVGEKIVVVYFYPADMTGGCPNLA